MSLTYLAPPNPAFVSDLPRNGILLNAHRSYPSSATSSSSSSHPPSPASSSSDTSDTNSKHTHRPSQPIRRIRFAPLPDPRRDLLPTNDQPLILLDQDDSRSSDDKDPSASYDPVIPFVNGSPEQQSISLPKPASPWSTTKKLLRPFYKPSSKKSSNESSSALGLFRPTSRDSTASISGSTLPSFGSPLKRSMSTGSSAATRPIFGHPLTTVASENYGVATNPRATRMLNGRVYGAPRNRPATSPGAGGPAEPEFVEWGYGGMGSQRSAQAIGSSVYSKVQSSESNAITGSAAEEDDGSGMGWVKRRREAREQERKAREDEAANGAAPEAQDADTPSHPAAPSPPHPSDQLRPVPLLDDTLLTASPPSEPIHLDTSFPTGDMDQHICRAVKIPPSRSNSTHSHRLPPSRQNTDPGVGTPIGQRSGHNSGTATPIIGRRSTESVRTVTATPTSPSAPLATPASNYLRRRAENEQEATLGEESEEEESTSTDREEYEEDDEDELSDEEKKRMTARCAGVEKISRHK